MMINNLETYLPHTAAAGDDSASDDSDEVMEVDPSKKNGDAEEQAVSSEWWAAHVKEEDKYDHAISGKIMLLAEVLRLSEAIGDKV